MSLEETSKFGERPDKIALYNSLNYNPLVQEFNAARDIKGLTERILTIDKIMSDDVTKFVHNKNCILNISILAQKDEQVRREVKLAGSYEGYRNELIRMRDTDVLQDAFDIAYLSEIGNRQREGNIFAEFIKKCGNSVPLYEITGKIDFGIFAEDEKNAIESRSLEKCTRLIISYSYRMKKMNALAYGTNRVSQLTEIEKMCFPNDIVFQRPVHQYMGYMKMIHQQRIFLIGKYAEKEIQINK